MNQRFLVDVVGRTGIFAAGRIAVANIGFVFRFLLRNFLAIVTHILLVFVVGFRQAVRDCLLPCGTIRRAARGISGNEMKTLVLDFTKAPSNAEPFVRFSRRLHLFFVIIPYNRTLLDLAAYSPPFKAEFHVGSPLKKSGALLPADTSLAVLKPNELLFHLSAAVRADFI